MAFLSHSIPWVSLSHLFEYHPARSRPGPQEADLYGKESPANRKQLEHFARAFQDTVREHALIERSRYSTAEAYRNRAASWTKSSVEEPPGQEQDAQSSNANTRSSDARHQRWGGKGPSEPTADVWTATSSTESRRVYPTCFLNTYMSPVSPTSGGAYGREGLLKSLADISTWIDHCTADRASTQGDLLDEKARNKLWLDSKSCADVLKLLVIDAATSNDESQRRKRLSTLLLLANHPGVDLRDFLSDGMCCCNIDVGLRALVDKTAMVFIYLNLLLALVGDDQHADLLRSCYSLEEYGPNSRHGINTIRHLHPRPAYMNTRSFRWMLEQLLDEHCHTVEHVFFNSIFAPRLSGRRSKWLMDHTMAWVCEAGAAPHVPVADEARFERDVMADRQGLREALKQMWKVLVFCDMVFREAEKPINWERASFDAIGELFVGKAGMDKLVGQDWIDYQLDREEEGSFRFYTNWGVY